jgi:hypothetical protein
MLKAFQATEINDTVPIRQIITDPTCTFVTQAMSRLCWLYFALEYSSSSAPI